MMPYHRPKGNGSTAWGLGLLNLEAKQTFGLYKSCQVFVLVTEGLLIYTLLSLSPLGRISQLLGLYPETMKE